MKCAMEMVAIATAEKARQEMEAMKKAEIHRIEVIRKTIEWCEEIGKKLEEMSYAGKIPRYSLCMNRDLTNEMWSSNRDYADKRLSWHYGQELDFPTMEKWFSQYCFQVRIVNSFGWRYNFGQIRLSDIFIEPAPQC